MTAEIHCPNCQSQNVIFSKKRGVHVCEDCGHVLPEKPVAPMRIFLSYGHDANEPLVRRIKTDLEERGHDVWFDKNEIRPGDSWRRSITDGILECDRFLSFLSKHSTRDPGVCRDEIAISIGHKDGNIQTILVESETEVQPPVSISHVQWLDMHDWEDGHGSVEVKPNQPAAGDAAWERWYDGNWKEIQRIIESEQSRQFAGEMDKLSSFLKPIKSHTRIKQLLEKGFIGRTWLFDAVETWRLGSKQESRLFWITGDPGVGKSAFAAQLTHTRPAAIIAAQFVEWDKPDHRDARRVVRSLAFQLATRLPDYRKLLLTLPEIAELDRKDPAELFDYLLANPLKTVIGGGRERLLIVIDALDEAGGASATGEAGRNPLVEMLARHAPSLPDWLGLVVTSRPESAVQTPLQGLNPFVLDTRTEANRADLRDFLRHQLAPQLQHRPDLSRQSEASADADRLIGQILEKSEGVFLYAERFCDDVQHGHLSLDRPDQFPQGLGGIFCQWFQRQFPDLEKFRKDIRPALRAILAAREPLPVEILQRLFHWQDEELRDFTRTLGSLFPITKDANGEFIKPYHKSLADWLVDEAKAGEHFVSVLEGHKALAVEFNKEWKSKLFVAEAYWAKHANSHIRRSGAIEEAALLFRDPAFQSLFCRYAPVSRTRGCDVFVSFSRKDNQDGQVAQLLPFLESAYADCTGQSLRWFFDTGDITCMDDWRHRILAGLRESNLLLLVLSPAYIESPYCEWESDEFLKYEHSRSVGTTSQVLPVYLKEIPRWEDPQFEEHVDPWVRQVKQRAICDLRPLFQKGSAALNVDKIINRLDDFALGMYSQLSKLRRLCETLGNLPAHNPHFVGRETEMQRLHEAAGLGRFGVLTAVQGMGGVGKSTLAIQYAYAYADIYPGGRWLVGCVGETSLASALRRLDLDLGLTLDDAEKRDDTLAARRVLAELERLAIKGAKARSGESDPPQPWALLLLDHVDHPALLQPPQSDILTDHQWLHVIATTRSRSEDFGNDPERLTVLCIDELPEDDALRLIESYQPSGIFPSPQEGDAALELVRIIGGFTLAVEVVAVYLGERAGRVTCAALLERLQKEGLGNFDNIIRDTKRGIRHGEKLIGPTLRPTLDLLSEPERLVLSYAALSPPSAIALAQLRSLAAKEFPELGCDSEPGYDAPWLILVNHLIDLGLLRIVEHDEDSLTPRIARMNPLVHAVIEQDLRLE